jgi:regulator of sirC expression with transglutaminase-like and TPR domain
MLQCRDHRDRAKRHLTELLAAEGELDLVEAALWVAAEEYPDLDVAHECGRVRLLCAEGARRVHETANPFARLDGLRVYLFEELGFHGNLEQYNDPRNSFLNEVLDRRTGIRVSYDGRTILVDPFHAGSVITQEDCKQLVARSTGRGWLFRPDYLEGTTERGMLARLLMNLKYAYLGNSDYPRALSVVERLLLVSPDDSSEIRDRGFLKARLGQPGDAIADLERYLRLSPDAPDTKSVEGRLGWLRRRQSEAN